MAIKPIATLKSEIAGKFTGGSDKWTGQEVEDSFIDTVDSLNALIPATGGGVSTNGKVITYFGDSITGDAQYSYVSGVNANLGTTSRNYARSGSTIVGTRANLDLCPMVDIAVSENMSADIIVFAIGSNGTSQPNIGTFSAAMAKTTLGALDKSLVYEAYRYALWSVRQNWPNAKVFCIVPPQQDIGFTNPDQFKDMEDAIKRMAQHYNAWVIDARWELGICTQFEVGGANGRYLVDGLHPNAAGTALMVDFYSREIKKRFA